jgi:phosphonatase-like hydrolase
MVKLIVFDMAGTVVNENNVVYKTLQQSINEAGINVTLEQVLAEGAGKEKSKAIKDIVSTYAPGSDQSALDAIYQSFITKLEVAYKNLDVTPVEGAENVFQQLRDNGVQVALNTGYKKETANQLIDKLEWVPKITFDEMVTASDVKGTRPAPDMIFHAMELCRVTSAGDVVKVGDSIVDIEEGKNAGCGLTVGITTGAHTREQLHSAHPDYIIDSLEELMPIVLRK